MSNQPVPDDFFECFLCDTLQVTLEELNRQDNKWVIKMITYLGLKSKYEEHKQKSANSSGK